MNETFEDYLHRRNYQPYTIKAKLRVVSGYEAWLGQNNSAIEMANHSTAIAYIAYLKTKRQTIHTINLKLSNLRQFYNFLAMGRNPFRELKVKGKKSKVFTNLLSEDELLMFYLSFPEQTELDIRTKILAGFYLFQGIATREMVLLEIGHLDLQRRRVIIPETLQGNKRILPLNPIQMVLLNDHFSIPLDAELLIFQTLSIAKNKAHIINRVHFGLKGFEGYKSLFQLRHSVVMNWLKRSNLRQVQYNAGHRYISTTEKYLESDYEELRIAIVDKHPLGLL
jgi:integrase/recombinase XerD